MNEEPKVIKKAKHGTGWRWSLMVVIFIRLYDVLPPRVLSLFLPKYHILWEKKSTIYIIKMMLFCLFVCWYFECNFTLYIHYTFGLLFFWCSMLVDLLIVVLVFKVVLHIPSPGMAVWFDFLLLEQICLFSSDFRFCLCSCCLLRVSTCTLIWSNTWCDLVSPMCVCI